MTGLCCKEYNAVAGRKYEAAEGRWWLGTGGTLYKCVWEGGLPVKQWAVGCYKLHTVLV